MQLLASLPRPAAVLIPNPGQSPPVSPHVNRRASRHPPVQPLTFTFPFPFTLASLFTPTGGVLRTPPRQCAYDLYAAAVRVVCGVCGVIRSSLLSFKTHNPRGPCPIVSPHPAATPPSLPPYPDPSCVPVTHMPFPFPRPCPCGGDCLRLCHCHYAIALACAERATGSPVGGPSTCTLPLELLRSTLGPALTRGCSLVRPNRSPNCAHTTHNARRSVRRRPQRERGGERKAHTQTHTYMHTQEKGLSE